MHYKQQLLLEKDRLYNDVVAELTANSALFPFGMHDKDVERFVNIITNVLWYLDGNQHKINNRKKWCGSVNTEIPLRYVYHKLVK